MAAWRSTIEQKAPAFEAAFSQFGEEASTALSQEAEVGV
jgi:3-methyladenine DNA glycosylase Tag